MLKQVEEENLSFFLLLITDIINADSMAVVLGDKVDLFEKAFNKKLENDKVLLEGVIYRKKQVLPKLEEKL